MDSPPEYDENTMTINPNNLPEEAIPAEPRPANCYSNDLHPNEDRDKHDDESRQGLECSSNAKQSYSHTGTQSSIETKHTGVERGSEVSQ